MIAVSEKFPPALMPALPKPVVNLGVGAVPAGGTGSCQCPQFCQANFVPHGLTSPFNDIQDLQNGNSIVGLARNWHTFILKTAGKQPGRETT